MNALGQQLCAQILPGLGWQAPQCSRAASALLSLSIWRNALRSFSLTASPGQQHQQQEVADTGLAFDEVYVDSSSLTTVDTPDARRLHQEPPLTAVFLHGLLGSNRNWRSFSRKLALEAAAHTDRDVRFLLVDLRCHGATAARHGFHPPHNMAAAAEDVAELIQQQLGGAAPHLLVGLSLGGKVALQLLKHLVEVQESKQQLQQVEQPVQHLYSTAPAIAPPEDAGQQQQEQSHSQALLQGLPQQVWVLDSQPGCVPLDVDAPTSVGRIIDLIHTIPTPLENRQVLYKLLVPQGIPLSVAQWLGTSLMPGGRLGNGNGGSSGRDQNLDWAFDVQGCAALYNSYRLSSYWDCLSRPPPDVTVHLVRGELSDRWTPHMLQQLEDTEKAWRAATAANSAAVGNLQLHVLDNAGHWLQADNPDGLHAMMLPWIRDMHQNRLVH